MEWSLRLVIIGQFLLMGIQINAQSTNLLIHAEDPLVKINPVTKQRQTEKIYYQNFVSPHSDSVRVLSLIHLVNAECIRNAYLDLELVQQYVYTGLTICARSADKLGSRRLQEALSWAHFIKGDLDSAKYFFTLLEDEANQHCNALRQWMFNYYMAWAFHNESAWDSAGTRYIRALEFAEAYGDSNRMLSTATQLAKLYYNKGDYVSAVKACYEIKRDYAKPGSHRGFHYINGLLASIYSDMKLYDREIALIRTTIGENRNTSDSSVLFWVNTMAANAYLSQKKYDSVYYYARQNVPLFKMGNMFPVCWLSMGQAFMEEGQLDSARLYFRKARLENDSIVKEPMPEILLALGKLAIYEGKLAEALRFTKQAENQIKDNERLNNRETYKVLADIYNRMGKYKECIYYKQQFQTLEDSALNVKLALGVGIIEMEFEAEKMENQIAMLNRDKGLQSELITKERQQKKILNAGSAAIILLGGFGFFRFRKHREQKARQALLDERLRISRDLHDEVGATLSGIAMYSHLAKQQIAEAKHQDTQQSLDTIQQSSGDMVNKLSDIVWLLNPDHDTFRQLVEKLEDYAKRLALTKRIQVKVTTADMEDQSHVPVEVRRNIYLIFKEAINNAFKYSQATAVHILVEMQGQTIRFSIEDNGIGFNIRKISGGNGLRNMQRRAEEIGAKLEMSSVPGEGTHILLQYRT